MLPTPSHVASNPSILYYLLSTYLSPTSTSLLSANLPFVLKSITLHQLLKQPSSHPYLHKWITRINSLMQSKIAEERFAGVCCMRLTIEQVDDVIGEWDVKWA